MPRRRALGTDTSGASLRSWRVTTAVRVFALSLSIGIVLAEHTVGQSGPMLLALGIIAGVASLLDAGGPTRLRAWLPIGEALLVALILTGSSASTAQPALYAYLAVPPVVAGVRHGMVTVVNATFMGGLAVLVVSAINPHGPQERLVVASAPWLLVGLGAGLLASWQYRSARDQDARQAPYAAAHQMMARLHQLAEGGTIGLDSTLLAKALDRALRQATGAARSAVFVTDTEGRLRPIVNEADAERLAAEISIPDSRRTPGAAVVPLMGVNQVLGYCVLAGVQRWTHEVAAHAREVADDFALRIDTAVLFDEVRHMATSEERDRIAREMHDGVAQEIVALGYVVDEIESIAADPETRALAGELREEISRVVTELRYSIFDLRHDVADHELTAALADYVQEVNRDTDLRVHLVLDNTGPRLPTRTRSEVMRIAQEAIGNVRRHAQAANLWVTYVSDGARLLLEVADDGVGNAHPKGRHWGLQTMRERAQCIGGELTIDARAGGGTVVRLVSDSHHVPSEGSSPREHHSPAG